MEAEGERFGAATGLDSVSTFECIVEGFDHFFMEMNTRIQVEHGVTELVYRLRFTNPDDPERAASTSTSLIEAMALLALHGARAAASPSACRAQLSGVEVRINATNQALQPHAGGLIRELVAADPGRDPLRPGHRHRAIPTPARSSTTTLAGAYDSNIALVLTDGDIAPRELRAHGRDPAPHGAARRRPPDQPRRCTTA